MSGDTFNCYKWREAPGIWPRDATKHIISHRTAPNNDLAPKVTSARLRNSSACTVGITTFAE